jgi:hypothetical protein
MSGPFTEDPRLLPRGPVPRSRDTLAAHSDDPVLGICPRCRHSRCEAWRLAYGRLYRAGELAGAHARWRDLITPPERREP